MEITDNGVFFAILDVDTNKISKFSTKIPIGALRNGSIINSKEFIKALETLHDSITPRKNKKVAVIVTLSDSNIYTQSFVLPILKESDFKETVRLNMQVISPINFSGAYSDWQNISDQGKSVHETEILSSFVDKNIINSMSSCLSQADFTVLAIEQKAASLVRVIDTINKDHEKYSYFIMHINSDGMSFSVVREGSLYFNRFSPWETIVAKDGSQREISFDQFKSLIIQEGHRVINFYSGRFQDNLKKIYIVAPGIEEQVKNILMDNFVLEVSPLSLNSFAVDVSWSASLGAAIRGIVSRSQDREISLAPEDTENKFFHSQVTSFFSIWKNVIIATLSVIVFAYWGVFVFLDSFSMSLAGDVANLSANHNIAYLNTLKKEAEQFNTGVDKAIKAKGQIIKISDVVSSIYSSIGSNVSIDRLSISGNQSPASISARTTKESYALDFKNKIELIDKIERVDMPLSSFSDLGNGFISFRINFFIKK
ncbi:MAG: pilus assembly protein PilM [Candidatus Paceibacterota bacterium]